MLGIMRAGERRRQEEEELRARHPSAMPPSHPGEILRDDVLPALGLSRDEAAARLGIDSRSLGEILAGTAPITPEIAESIGELCGNGGAIWIRMQRSCAAWHLRNPQRIFGLDDVLMLAGFAAMIGGALVVPAVLGRDMSWGGFFLQLGVGSMGIACFAYGGRLGRRDRPRETNQAQEKKA